MDNTKRDAITRRIANLIAAGTDPIDACREVLGAGNVDRMINELYSALRARETH